ncbi:helix-turn-helix domain-containing protein [Dyella telluris]|uniref:CRP-like protein Clp n=1 Tax=Dyella telluris TaxID=2763498 RepID=A0A7G8Q334_9GAMM|nr:helix-turn-helix domain-containing protein [Dyella telluris]QNK01192.1 helix-turn-helix domain-containing protein [Dyella telluris]
MSPELLVLSQVPDRSAPQDGDAIRFCHDCAFSAACQSEGYGKQELAALQCVVEHVPMVREGGHVFRRGEPFRALYAVRSGSVKTSIFSRDGREQVLGFYLPGEVVGLNGIYPESYPCDAMALEDASFCHFAFPAMSTLATALPVVQQHLFRLLSKELGMASLLAGDHSAEERVAAFLLDLGERHAQRGQSSTAFRLAMSRSDIASYLRLAPETVSRVISRFREKGWVSIQGRRVQLKEITALRELSDVLCQLTAAA